MSPWRSLDSVAVEAWRAGAEADLDRLRSLGSPQLAAEVLRRGFASLEPDGERTQIGLSNSLCPEAPAAVGENDIDVVQQYAALLAGALVSLEEAGLLTSEIRGRSGLRFYRLTDHGRSRLRRA